MSRPARGPSRLAIASLRVATWTMPRRFRDAYADDILALYRDRHRDLAGAPASARVRFLVGNVVDVARAGLAERRRSSFHPTRPSIRGLAPRSGDGLLKNLLFDLHHALRAIAHRPGFAALVVLTLALGIGANSAIFTVLHAVVLEELPYAEPDRLVRVYESNPDDPSDLWYLRAPVVREYLRWDDVFERLGTIYSYREVGADLTDGDRPLRVAVTRVSAGYFETLGVAPVRGRTFTDDESFGPGEQVSSTLPITPVAIVSHTLWTDHFGGDPGLVGATIQLDGVSLEVVGVMARGFTDPFGARADVWVPQDLRPGGSNRFNNWYLSAVARLRPGVSVESAQERVAVLAAAFAEAEPDAGDAPPRLVPLQSDVVGSTRQTMLWILAGAAGLVLLTACTNVANLVFARGMERDRDLALRAALGCGRGRLLAGLLAENGILALAGGAAGVALGWVGVRWLLVVSPDALPGAARVEMNATVLAFAAAVTVATLVAFALGPALRLSRTTASEVLRSGDRAATMGRVSGRVRQALVVVQVAAALMLVAGSMLLVRSFDRLLEVPLGLEPAGVLTYEVNLPTARYQDGASRQRFHEQLHDRVSALPGVESAGAVSWLPVNGAYHSWGFSWSPEGLDENNQGDWYFTDVRAVAGEYFRSMGIDLLEGEPFESADLEGELQLWVNHTVAEAVFGGDAVGQVVWMGNAMRRIAGVVEDVPQDTRGTISRTTYVPHAQYADNRNWTLVQTVKTRGHLVDLQEQIRRELAAIDPLLVMHRPQSLVAFLSRARAQDRFATLLMGGFATLALLLSLVGTYGVLAGSVVGRTREIGIRMALGADRDNVRGMILRYAARLILPGVVLGLMGSWLAGRWVAALLFSVQPADPVALGLTLVAFAAVGMIAGWVPARRATRVDAAETLRSD